MWDPPENVGIYNYCENEMDWNDLGPGERERVNPRCAIQGEVYRTSLDASITTNQPANKWPSLAFG